MVASSSAAHAEPLQWQQKVIEITASPRQERVEASFVFKNTGASPVTITGVHGSCDCTTAEPDRRRVPPGESGTLRAVFELRGRVGRQEKTLTVTTAEAPTAPSLLTLRVHIPELVEVKPRMLVWRVGEPPTERQVDVFMATNETHGVVDVQCDDPTVSARVETDQVNRRYRIFLKPGSTASMGRSVARVNARAADTGEVQSFTIYLQVR